MPTHPPSDTSPVHATVPVIHLPDVKLAPAPCANCDTPRVGEYCHACGQHYEQGRLTIRGLIGDFLVRKMGLEGGLVRTMVDLTLRPARAIRGYVDGRRQRYTHPVAYMLLACGAYALLTPLWVDVFEAGIRAENADLSPEQAEPFAQAMLATERHPALTIVVLGLFLVPVLRLFFRRSTTLGEASVFTLYLSAHLTALGIVVNLGALAFASDSYAAMNGAASVIPTLAVLLLSARFFGAGLWTYAKFAVAMGIAFFSALIAIMIGVAVMAGVPAAT